MFDDITGSIIYILKGWSALSLKTGLDKNTP